MKKLSAFILALLLVFTAVSASAGYFYDVTDPETVKAVEQLRMLGIIDGMGHGNFAPNDTLTRAQFCKMAVVAQGAEAYISQYKNYTIFPDVRQSHWAISYINYAVRSENKFIAGFPNGTFQPDTPITYGQAITILMRLLGYTDSDAGLLWPDGYIQLAKGIGLSDGVTAGGYDTITRAQAAKLFANLLLTDRKAGGKFVTGIFGSPLEDVILLSNTAVAPDGTENALLTSKGVYKTAVKAASADLVGEKGTLIIDEKGKAVTFIPNEDALKNKITASAVKSSYVEDSSGRKIAIPGGTEMFYENEITTWEQAYTKLRRGCGLTLYYSASGNVDFIFAGGGYADHNVMVLEDKSSAEIDKLVGSGSYQLYRNGEKAAVKDLRKYDIAMYDPMSGRVDVCDARISLIYEDAYPNFITPEKICALDAEFTVLPTALDNLVSFKPGDAITLLLTADGKVANVLSAKTVSGNAKGVVKSVSRDYASVELTCGITVSGDPRLGSLYDTYLGRVVTLYSDAAGRMTMSKLSGIAHLYSDWVIADGKIGDMPVSDALVVYEYLEGSALTRLDVSSLSGTIPADKIMYSEAENGIITLIILNDYTGNGYVYGRAIYDEGYVIGDMIKNATLSVENSEGITGPLFCRGIFDNGEWIGVAVSADGQYEANTIRLTKFEDIDFSLWNGGYVIIKGERYKVSDDLQCYNSTLRKWTNLETAKLIASSADLYCLSGVVRGISVKQ